MNVLVVINTQNCKNFKARNQLLYRELILDMDNSVRRLWLDFRSGHSIYLIFALTFANFITIQFTLVIEKIPSISSFINSLWMFAIMFLVMYIPLAIVIGYWHRKSQFKVESAALFSENPLAASLWLFLIKLIEGKVTEEEKNKVKDMLTKISSGDKSSESVDSILRKLKNENK